MRAYQKADGQVLVSKREYDIAASTAIEVGQVVKLADGLVVAAGAGEAGAILGIAAETHSGAADALDPRSNGTRILVCDDPELVMQCAAPRAVAAASSTTTVVITNVAAFGANDLKGGYVKLVSKGEDSTNTESVGTVRRITASAAASSGSVTLTVEEGGTAAAGDVYEIYPPIGFKKGNLGSNHGLVLTATASLSLKVVGHDRDTGKINLMAHLHALGVED